MVSMNALEKLSVNSLNRRWVPKTVLHLLEEVNVQPTGTILEIGAGLGYRSHAIFKKYHPAQMFICDYDASQVEAGKKLAEKEFGSMPAEFVYQREDVLELSFADEIFDMVISTLMFGHVENSMMNFKKTPQGIGEIQRVLKPGGIYLYWEVNNQKKVERLFRDAGYAVLFSGGKGWNSRKQRVFQKP
jgi:ubiquinone/menaquinone biosynthesis C-methylase UbiE